MTPAQFRLLPAHVTRMREILDDPIFASAIVALRDSKVVDDVSDVAPEVASVRALSRLAGYAECLTDLMSLSQPAPLPIEDTPEDWGAETTQGKP